jgi:UDP-N-acetylmuramoyl-L-alanyl-D-glutamate--2,6-diaminopimelate ligase
MMVGFVRKDLFKLIRTLPAQVQAYWPEKLPKIPVTGVTFDSRAVEDGFIFVCVRGTKVDGHAYIPQAIERGAVAVVGMDDLSELAVPYIRVSDARAALAHLAAAFYDNPAHYLTMIGVTGTDGKTTTSNLIYQILLAAGLRAGIISTVNAVIGDEVLDTGFHVTTPEAPDVQKYLTRMRTAGLTHVVLESTSYGLAQKRVTGCEFDIGVVTNITHEHLDYHETYEAYRDAKGLLFSSLADTPGKDKGNPRLAVINRDDGSFEFLNAMIEQSPSVRNISYGIYSQATVTAEDISYNPECLSFTAVGPGFRQKINSCLVGEFNISNCLAAISATVIGLGIPPEVAAQGIHSLPGVAGRMERITMGQNFLAIVDFAHTPNALKQALMAARKMTQGKLIVVFGSAGLRDREKRWMMAGVAEEYADISILTAEDPRTESLTMILEEMANGARDRGGIEGKTFWRIMDRGEAIRTAVRMAGPTDLVISCGKGHEQSMCFGTTEYAWDDRTAMRAALAELSGLDEPKMPFLPTQAK